MTVRTQATAPVQLLTIPETAERLRCSDMHVYRLIAIGKLRPIDIAQPGSRKPKTRISEAALAAYIEGAGDAA